MIWQTKKLGDVIVDIKDGGTPSRKKPEYFGGNVNWAVVKDILPEIYETKEKLTEQGLRHSSAKVWPVDSVIISLGATIGNVGIAKVPLATKQGLSGIVANKKLLLPKYLVYILNWKKEYIQNIASGTTIKEVRPSKLKEMLVFPVPSLREQHHIVKKLDDVFEKVTKAKENAEKNLQNSKELFESYLQSVFTNPKWVNKRLGDIAEHSLGKMLDKAKNKGELKPYLRNLNVRWFEFDLSDIQEMKFEAKEIEKYTAVKGDILVCEGGYPGRSAIWMDEHPVYFQKAIHRVRFPTLFESKWFLYYLYLLHKTGGLKKYLTGTGILHFTGETLDSFVLPVATTAEQKAIVKKLDALSAETKKLEKIYEQKLTDLDELKKSVLQRAFTGKL